MAASRLFGCGEKKKKNSYTELEDVVIQPLTMQEKITTVARDVATCIDLLDNNVAALPCDKGTYIPSAASIIMVLLGIGACIYRAGMASDARNQATDLSYQYDNTVIPGTPLNGTCSNVRFTYYNPVDQNWKRSLTRDAFCSFSDDLHTWGNSETTGSNLMGQQQRESMNYFDYLNFLGTARRYCESLTKELCAPIFSNNARGDLITGLVVSACILMVAGTFISWCCRASKSEKIGRNMNEDDAATILALAEKFKLPIDATTSTSAAKKTLTDFSKALEKELCKLNNKPIPKEPDQTKVKLIEESIVIPGKEFPSLSADQLALVSSDTDHVEETKNSAATTLRMSGAS